MQSSDHKNMNLSPGVRKAFYNFLLYTNFSHGGTINNNAWEALYDFVKYTHAHKVLLSDDQFKNLLISEGARVHDAEKFSTIYLHCRNLLYKKRPWDSGRMYSWLKNKKQRMEEREEHLYSLKNQ